MKWGGMCLYTYVCLHACLRGKEERYLSSLSQDFMIKKDGPLAMMSSA